MSLRESSTSLTRTFRRFPIRINANTFCLASHADLDPTRNKCYLWKKLALEGAGTLAARRRKAKLKQINPKNQTVKIKKNTKDYVVSTLNDHVVSKPQIISLIRASIRVSLRVIFFIARTSKFAMFRGLAARSSATLTGLPLLARLAVMAEIISNEFMTTYVDSTCQFFMTPLMSRFPFMRNDYERLSE